MTDTGLVTVTVTPVDDAPVAGDDSVTALGNTDTLITEAQLLANDTDVDGPSLSVTAVSDALNGSVSLASGVIERCESAHRLDGRSFTTAVPTPGAVNATTCAF